MPRSENDVQDKSFTEQCIIASTYNMQIMLHSENDSKDIDNLKDNA